MVDSFENVIEFLAFHAGLTTSCMSLSGVGGTPNLTTTNTNTRSNPTEKNLLSVQFHHEQFQSLELGECFVGRDHLKPGTPGKRGEPRIHPELW